MKRTPETRKNWIIEMYGSGAETDFSKKAKVVVKKHGRIRADAVTGEPYVFPAAFDIENHDMPAPDIIKKKTKGQEHIRIGSKKPCRKDAKEITNILNSNFTAEELRGMNLYYEYPAPKVNGVVALHTGYKENGKKFSIIEIAKHTKGLEDTLTHETIHARRYATGDMVNDQDQEEIETELETVARISNQGLKERYGGYYQYLKHGRPRDLIREDRARITGDATKRAIGKGVLSNIRKELKHSHIQKYDGEGRWEGFAKRDIIRKDREYLDRYFEIRIPGEGQVQHHIRQDRPITQAATMKFLRSRFGKGIIVFEWKDGKKYRLK